MELTDELLLQIIGGDDLRFGDRFQEKRQTPRIPFGTPVMVQPLERGSPALQARTRDISKSGIGLLCSTRMVPGRSFLLRLPQSRGKHLWICCMVARCDDVGDGLFIVGAGFERVVPSHTAAAPIVESRTRTLIAVEEFRSTKQADAPAHGARPDQGQPDPPAGAGKDSLIEYLRQRRAQRRGQQ